MSRVKTSSEMQKSVDELREVSERLESAVYELRETGIREDLLIHAIWTEANRGLPSTTKTITKTQIRNVINALADLPGLIFEDVDDE